MTWRLTAEEDAELRRLHALIRFANGTSPLAERYRVLRARDRRKDVREIRSDDLVHEVTIPYPADPVDEEPRASVDGDDTSGADPNARPDISPY